MTARDELARLLAKTDETPRSGQRGRPGPGHNLNRVHKIRREAWKANRGKRAEMAARFDELHNDDEIFLETVLRVVGKSATSIRTYRKAGTFPDPARKIKAPGTPVLSNVWRVGDVRAWLAR